MNGSLISFIIGYIVVINIISISIIWLKVKTNFIKIPDKILDFIYIILSIIGGFVGILMGSEMMGYRREEKIFKRWIPLIIFIEICIIVYIIYTKNK